MDYQVDEYLVCSGAPQKPAAARQVLSEMDVQLITARAANVSEAEIAVECYLPMFDAAILLNHFPKARKYAVKSTKARSRKAGCPNGGP